MGIDRAETRARLSKRITPTSHASDTEADWLGVPDATMYWSHADETTYQQWLTAQEFRVLWTRFIPEGQGGHTLVLAQTTA